MHRRAAHTRPGCCGRVSSTTRKETHPVRRILQPARSDWIAGRFRLQLLSTERLFVFVKMRPRILLWRLERVAMLRDLIQEQGQLQLSLISEERDHS